MICFSEGFTILKNDLPIVEFGVVKKKITTSFGIESEAIFADFNWDNLLKEITTQNFEMQPISKFPKVKRDFALLLDSSVSFIDLKLAALQTEKTLLKDVHLFDVYTGSKLPKGKKSYALSFTLQHENKTLTDKQIDKIMSKLQQKFEADFGASLR